MDLQSENTSSLQMDERYKKLERAVKIIQMMQLDKKDTESCASAPTINISSINGDAFDTSCAFSFKLGSEVVSSSNNMRNLMSQKIKALNRNNNNIVTSSVKASPSNDEAKAIMPPPKTIPNFLHSSSKNTSIKSSCSFQETFQPKYETGIQAEEKNVSSTIQPDRIFQRWKVSINGKGQLVIQGKLKDSVKTVRSKPVIRRISSVMVQSCYNNIYELQGRIDDEENTLPEYIRGKFYNGFPDDWENVYQLWRSYIAGGCKSTFRWPTPVTDSDDDLQSDITEVVYHKSPYDPINPYENQRKKIMSPQIHPEKSLEKSSCEHSIENVKNQTFSLEEINNTNKVSLNKSQNPSMAMNNTSEQIDLFLNQVDNLQVNNSSLKNNVIDEDISSAVSKIFASRNISIECIDKIIEMFNCYKYVVMSKPTNSSPKTMRSNQDVSVTEKIPSEKNVVTNFNATYTNSEINQNRSFHSHRSYNRESKTTPRHTRRSTSVKNIRAVRKKLLSKDYDSFEDSSDDSEVEKERNMFYKKNFKLSRMSNTKGTETIKEYNLKHQSNDESDDNFIPKMTKYQSPGHTDLTKSVNKINDQVNVQHTEIFKKPLPQIQYRKVLQDCRSVNSSSLKHHQQRNLPPSKGTGFVDDDSCVSLSEDDQRIKNHSKLNDKKLITQLHRKISPSKLELNQANSNHGDDSCASFSEAEVVVNNKVENHNVKKQVLQEWNMQFFQSMLGDVKYSKSKLVLNDKKNNSQNHQEVCHENEEECSSLQNRVSKELTYNKHTDIHINNDKENKLNQNEKKSPKKKAPIIVSVEKVSFDIPSQLSKKYYRGGVNKSKSPEKHKIKNDVEKEDKQQTKNFSKNSDNNSNIKISSLDSSSQSLKSKSTIQLSDFSIKLQNINDKSKNEHSDEEAKLDINNKKIIFGSKENPKKLTKWIPKVLKKPDSSYGLVFEGDLLNEIGHVESKKFTTGFITRRLSPKVVETEKHEFYQLIGDLTDTKYTIPKDLRKLCSNRCPLRITQFCERWKNILLKDVNESQLLNITTDISQSSRGRRRYPHLSYWTGERVTVKNNEVVYNPGDSSKSTIYSPFETSKKKSTQLSTDQNSSNTITKEKEQNKEKYSSRKKQSNLDEKSVENQRKMESSLRSTSGTSEKRNLSNVDKKEKEKNIDKNSSRKRNNHSENTNVEYKRVLRDCKSKMKKEKIKLRRSSRSQNRRIKSKVLSTSNDSSSEEDHPISKRLRRSNDAQKKENSLENENISDKECKLNKEKSNRKQSDNRTNTNKSSGITVKYYKEIPCKKDIDFSNYESSF